MLTMFDHTRASLKRDEGLRLKPYKDTEGFWTIGYGHNLSANGIPEEIANRLLDIGLYQALEDAIDFVGDLEQFAAFNEVRQSVLLNMAFNLGLTRLRKFKRFRAALLDEDYLLASVEMLDSLWAEQVGFRAKRLAREMKSGIYANGQY